MNVLFWKSNDNGASQALLSEIKNDMTEANLEILEGMDDLVQRLRRFGRHDIIAVLWINTKEELLDMLPIKDLLTGIRSILIVPDPNDETISRGHELMPRFVAFKDSNHQEITAILNKMIDNSKKMKAVSKGKVETCKQQVKDSSCNSFRPEPGTQINIRDKLI